MITEDQARESLHAKSEMGIDAYRFLMDRLTQTGHIPKGETAVAEFKTDDWAGRTIKFTIGREQHDCYLTIGEVGKHNREKYPHLKAEDPCYLDITLSRSGEELRVYSLLTSLATKLILGGESPKEVANIFLGQAFEPSGLVSIDGAEMHFYKSIPDFIGRYILATYYKEE